jgi:hypothetical protein
MLTFERADKSRPLLKERRFELSQWLWFGTWIVVTVIAWRLKPDHVGHGTHQQLGLPPCPSVIFFGRPCPACGLTTSWTATVHGDLPMAFQAHALGTILYVSFTISAFMAGWGALRHIRVGTDTPLFNRVTVIIAIVFFVYGVGRFALTKEGYRTSYENIWSGTLRSTSPP